MNPNKPLKNILFNSAVIGFAMAAWAKGDEIIQTIPDRLKLLYCFELAAPDDMMNRQILKKVVALIAHLTAVAVSLAGFVCLFIPVGSVSFILAAPEPMVIFPFKFIVSRAVITAVAIITILSMAPRRCSLELDTTQKAHLVYRLFIPSADIPPRGTRLRAKSSHTPRWLNQKWFLAEFAEYFCPLPYNSAPVNEFTFLPAVNLVVGRDGDKNLITNLAISHVSCSSGKVSTICAAILGALRSPGLFLVSLPAVLANYINSFDIRLRGAFPATVLLFTCSLVGLPAPITVFSESFARHINISCNATPDLFAGRLVRMSSFVSG